MPLTQLIAADGVSKRLLTASFTGILILLAALEALAYVEARRSQREADQTVSDALRSVELVGQLGMDIEHARTLVERHILSTTTAEMQAVEGEIAATRADFRATAASFGAQMNFSGEHAAWFSLARDVALKRSLLPAVLTLSRENRDAEARRALDAMQSVFVALQTDVARLVAINRGGAQHARAELHDYQMRTLRFRIVIGAGVAIGMLLIGYTLTRTLSRNEQRLRDHTVAVESKNRELDAFAGRVAHDLRGPLSSISVASYLLAERAPQQQKTTAILQRGVTQMSNLVDELLALSRLGVASDGVGNTAKIAAAIAEDLEPRVRDAGGTLRVDVEAAIVRCGEALLRQVLWNLAENALKYRRPDVRPVIELVGRPEHDLYRLTVSDNGIGMTRQDADHMFEPFFRAVRTSSIAGTGLGLAIVRRIVDASGGTIRVSSELGRGTRIEIRFPLAGEGAAH